MHINFFTKLFSKHVRNASSIIVTNTTSSFINRTYYIPNLFVKQMNEINPQLTGHIIETIVSYLFEIQSTHIELQQILNIVQPYKEYTELYNILNNHYELSIFIKYVNSIILNFIGNTHNLSCIPIQLQEDLSFKYNHCCKTKKYRCFADVVFDSTILDIKVVRKSFYTKSNINSEIACIQNLNSLGIKYYNQLMMYACGFFKKYNHWPKNLIVFNIYTGETIIWFPTISNYESFIAKL